ncbi:MAG TPA: putative quinol monooxygenase [Acidimicrobiales bacterium]|jgi:quinol monooxygenase YgiN|nr:putative quinol monooxygenase [Acidimicrobiales bacterium]
MAIVIAGRVKIREDAKQGAIEQGAQMAATSRGEAGCLDYRFGFDVEDPSVVIILEHWESEEALSAHMAAPHFQAFTGFIVGVVDGPVNLTRHEVSESKPLFG